MAVKATKPKLAEALDCILSDVNNVPSTAGSIKIYTGGVNSNPNSPPSGTLLVTCTISNNGASAAFGTTNTTSLTATGDIFGGEFASGTAGATGTAGSFALYTSGGTLVLQGTVAASGTPDLLLNTVSITSGFTVIILNCDITIEVC